MKLRGRDIVEVVARDLGYTEKSSDFNTSEWYGFEKNEKMKMRAKYVCTADKDSNYNFHFNGILEKIDSETLLYGILEHNSEFYVIKFDKNQKANLKLIVKTDGDDLIRDNIEVVKKFERDSKLYVIEKISGINKKLEDLKYRIEKNNGEYREKDIKDFLNAVSEHKCQYCGISLEKIKKLDDFQKEKNIDYGLTIRNRGASLEIDQIIPKKGYIKDNMILSCYWCNNAKTDTFSASEFKEIARGINQVWNQKMRKTGSHETICFPENSDIWNRE